MLRLDEVASSQRSVVYTMRRAVLSSSDEGALFKPMDCFFVAYSLLPLDRHARNVLEILLSNSPRNIRSKSQSIANSQRCFSLNVDCNIRLVLPHYF